MNLYDLTGDLLRLQELLESGEVVDTELLADVLADTTTDYEEKIENYAKIVKNLSANIDSLKAEAERLTKRRKALEANIDSLKSRMFDSMKATGKTKIKGDLFTVSIRANGGKVPVIVDVETAYLPDELVKIEEKPNLDAIAAYIELHPDTNLAHFGEKGESLSIR